MKVKINQKNKAATERDGGTRNALKSDDKSARGIMSNDGDLITISNVTLDKPDTDLVLPADDSATSINGEKMQVSGRNDGSIRKSNRFKNNDNSPAPEVKLTKK